MNYIYYEPNGRITGVIQQDASMMRSDAPNIALEVFSGSPADHYVEGELVVAIPPSPGNGYKFNYDTKQWEFNEFEQNERTLEDIRAIRDDLLLGCDWTQIGDNRLTGQQRAEYVQYRNKLRDMPETYADATDIDDVQWPEPPSL